MLIIWPEHCLIGSKGACIQEPLMQSLYNWESQVATVGKVTKGSNPHTEHYSAVRADVEDPKDKSTGLNTDLLDTLKAFDIILGAGEALSHCWLNTFNDIITNFGDEQIKKIICLDDTTSNVPGFEKIGFDFLDEMVAKGMGRTQTTKVFN
jgi:nicotinamidase-related amidase